MLNEILEKEHQTMQTASLHRSEQQPQPKLQRDRSTGEIKKGRLMREIKGMEQLLLWGAAQTEMGSLKHEENRDYYNALHLSVSWNGWAALEWGPCN